MIHLLMAALAAEPRTATPVTVDSAATDLYQFHVTACEAFRAEAIDARPMNERSTAVIVDLFNDGPAPCTWSGLALKGWIQGTFTANRKNPNDDGFSLAPGESVRIHLNLTDPRSPRANLQLQIPPGKGYVLLIGLAPPAEPSPPPAGATTPQPAAKP